LRPADARSIHFDDAFPVASLDEQYDAKNRSAHASAQRSSSRARRTAELSSGEQNPRCRHPAALLKLAVSGVDAARGRGASNIPSAVFWAREGAQW
jgi:hypothetical protein